MIAKCSKPVLLFLIFLFIFNLHGTADVFKSPINGIPLQETADSSFSFIIAGHIHGDQDNALYSAASFIVNIDSINNLNSSFIIFSGDMMENADSLQMQNFIKTISSKIKIPIFNAVGNHDVLFNRSIYEGFFGKTFYDFKYSNSKFLILDTEDLNRNQMLGNQLTFFKNSLQEAKADTSIKLVFIVSHRLIWFVNFEKLQHVFKMVSKQISNFKSDLEPCIMDVAKEKPVYWLSGDGGLHMFYHHDSVSNVTYISNAIQQEENDAIIKAIVNKAGIVKFKTISLTGMKIEPLEHYDLNYWNVRFEHLYQQFDPETQIYTVPVKIFIMLNHKYFWVGISCGIICVMIILIFLKKLNF